jgi:carboxyl-terminal processing protease
MIKSRILIVIIFFISCLFLRLSSQDTVTSNNEKLFYLCKVWGFVKYYHPYVSSCNINWDETILTFINDCQKVRNKKGFNKILLKLLDIPPKVSKPRWKNTFDMDSMICITDFKWIDNNLFEKKVKKKLFEIKDNFYPKSICYAYSDFNKIPKFDRDTNYFSKEFSSFTEAHFLLSLFRYWNIIEYFYPYKHLIDNNWDSVLINSIPEFLKIKNELDYGQKVMKLITKIHDAHSVIMSKVFPKWIGIYFLPFKLTTIDSNIVINRVLTNDSDLHIGDILKSINGISIDDLKKRLIPYVYSSNKASFNVKLNEWLLRGDSGLVKIEVQNDSGTKFVKVRRINNYYEELSKGLSAIHYSNDSSYVVINLSNISKYDVFDIFQNKKVKNLIFDLRYYPKFLINDLGLKLFEEPIAFAKFTIPVLYYPGYLEWTKPVTIGDNNPNYFTGKIFILVNENTMSAGEFDCMALSKFPNSFVIGSQTSGADGDVTEIKLPCNINTHISGIGVYYPDGRETQRIGIIPDIEVHSTIKGIQEGRDEVLEKAIEIINKK